MKHIEVVFAFNNNVYTFTSKDGKISLGHSNRAEVTTTFVRLFDALKRKGTSCRIEAYAPLGPSLKLLRDAGAICRVGLKKQELPSAAFNRARWQMPDMPVEDAPPPVFASWSDYLARTSYSERMKRCHAASKKSNRKRLLSDAVNFRLRGQDVWSVVEAARGRCVHCGSLAVENRPSSPTTGAPLAWAQVGRRIGSLEHTRRRFGGGGNELSNLAWSCLWCNTWETERRANADDHGGYYPED